VRPGVVRVACGEEPQPVGHAVADGRDRQRAGVGGCQLDGQREPVGEPADLGDRRALGCVGREPGLDETGPVDEQRGGVGSGQATERNGRLAARTERDAAGREDVQLRASRQEIVEEGGDPGPDVLAVVQDEQPGAVSQALRQSLGGGERRVVAQPAAGEDREGQ
jgi:hypothetical protein